MIRNAIAWLRERFAVGNHDERVEDADERFEGSGEAITSPQHRRSAAAERELERLEELVDESGREEP